MYQRFLLPIRKTLDNTSLADFFLNEDVQRYIGTIDTYRDGNDDTLSCRPEDFSEL